MATYGRGQTLGSGINPESFKQDYSGFARAAEIQAQGIANLGQSIGSAVGDYFKLQGEDKKKVKQAGTQIDAALKLFPDLAPTLSSVKDELRDDNIPLRDRAAQAEVVANLINMGISDMREKSSMELEREKLGIDKSYKEAQIEATKRAAGEPKIVELYSPEGDQQAFLQNGQIVPLRFSGFGQKPQATSTLQGLPEGLKSYASVFEEAGRKHGVDPKLLAAISIQETGGGTSSAFRNKNNAMGISDASGPVQMGSVAESIEKMASLIGKGINEGKGPYGNVKSIQDLANVYAPPGAVNDPNNLNRFWSQGVSSNLQKLIEAQAGEAQGTGTPNRLGFKPREAKVPTGTEITMDEYYAAVRSGQNIQGVPLGNNKFYVTSQQPFAPRKGQETIVNKDGSVTIRDIALDKKEEQAAKAEEAKINKASEIMKDLNLLETRSETMAPGVIGAVTRIGAEQIPGTPQAETKQIIDRVKSILTIENLQEMRNSNPTGASLGNISNTDVGLLMSSATSLANAQTPEAFRQELIRLKNRQHDLIYGSEQELRQKLKEGKITQSQFDEAARMAPDQYIDEKGEVQLRKPVVPSSGNSTGFTPEAMKAREMLKQQFGNK